MITNAEYKGHEIVFNDETHSYLVDGEPVPSVTTIIKEILPSMYSNVPKRILEKASLFGTRLHKATEINSNEGLDYYENVAFREYNNVLNKFNITPLEQEVFICYENPNYPENGLPKILFVGQTDMIADVNGFRCLVDKKFTSKYHKEYLDWQLSLYELACYERFKKLYCIHVPKKSVGDLYESDRIPLNVIMDELTKYYKGKVKSQGIKKTKEKKQMGKCVPVLIIGKSGSGKSASLRNLKKEEYSLVNPLAKRLPFENSEDIKGLESSDYSMIKKFIKETPKKIVVIDDSNYLLTMEMMSKINDKGYDKFTEMAKDYWDLIDYIKNLDGDKRVYLFSHEEFDDYGNIKVKTIGKMLDQQICVEGLFTIVLRAVSDNNIHSFLTHTSGNDIIKTPIGMFEESKIDNDLKLVDDRIKSYYKIKD